LYDRPEPRTDIPHVFLLYEGFGEFLDIFHGRKDVPGFDLSKQRAMEFRVNDFADEMASLYETESSRRFTAIPAMDILFSAFACEGEMGPFLKGTFDPPMSVGRVKGEHGAISCIVLFKNESCDIEIMPHIELINHVAHSFNAAMTQGRNDQLFRGWRVPCLGITIVGEWIVFGSSTRLIPVCNTHQVSKSHFMPSSFSGEISIVSPTLPLDYYAIRLRGRSPTHRVGINVGRSGRRQRGSS
jgi:hypothetical protein